MKQGVVLKTTGNFYWVREQDGGIIQCTLRGNLRLKGLESTNPAVVGDVVYFVSSGKEGVIEKIGSRDNYIVRKSIKLSSRRHIIAANIDRVILVVTLVSPKTHLEFIDRYLVTAEAQHIPAILLFNKIDLFRKKETEQLEKVLKLYREIGYHCLAISATDTADLSEVRKLLTSGKTLISGHSGVGKSTILNRISPEFDLKTSAISAYHQMGKHTTTYAEMFELPTGGFVIDTPGIKGLGVLDIPRDEISHYFPEMRQRLPACKYHNCVHMDEPECAVKRAVENGEIDNSRYRSYVSLFSEGDTHFRKPDHLK